MKDNIHWREHLELVEVIGHQGCVICLAHARHHDARDVGAKPTLLGRDKLLIVVNLVKLTAVRTALLQAKLVADGTHGGVLPLAEGGAIG